MSLLVLISDIVNNKGDANVSLDNIAGGFVAGAREFLLTGEDVGDFKKIKVDDFDKTADEVDVVVDLSTFSSDFELDLKDERATDTLTLKGADEIVVSNNGTRTVTFTGSDGAIYELEIKATVASVEVSRDGGVEIGQGVGLDNIEGGEGDDTISGGAGHDTIAGGEGHDNIISGVDATDLGGSGERSYDFPLIRLGQAADVDTDESNGRSENAEDLLGTYGGDGEPLSGSIVFAVSNDLNRDDNLDDNDNGGTAETFTINGEELALDSVQVYNAQVEFIDGTTGAFSAVVIQLENGEFFLAPEPMQGADSVLLQSGEIKSITLEELIVDDTNLYGLRLDQAYVIGDDDNVDGGSGDDTIQAGVGDDFVEGGIGGDHVYGGAGADQLYGGSGDDVLEGGSGEDYLKLGSGSDAAYGGAGGDTLQNASGDDLLFGGSGDDNLIANVGNDTLFGGTGNDTLTGGSGDDFLDGGDGSDGIFGGSGDDVIDGGDRTDTVFGGDGNDSISDTGGATSDDTLYGDAGDDTIDGGTREDAIFGGTGADSLIGASGDDSLFGGSGDDTILGDAGSDNIDGGVGNDTIDGGANDDVLFGGEGSDTLLGGDGNDTIDGGDGDDTLLSGAGDDLVEGGAGDDFIEDATPGSGAFNADFNNLAIDPGITTSGGSTSGARFAFSGDSSVVANPDEGGADIGDVSEIDVNFTMDVGSPSSGVAFSFGDPSSLDATGHLGVADGMSVSLQAATNEVVFLWNGVEIGRDPYGIGVVASSPTGNSLTISDTGLVTFTSSLGAGLFTAQIPGTEWADADTSDYAFVASQSTADGPNNWVDNIEFTGFVAGGNDTLTGGTGQDTIYGHDGDDSIDGGADDDVLDGGAGDDTILGGVGNNVVDGGAGADAITTEDGADSILGGDGNDNIDGGAGNDTIDGGAGDDSIVDGSGNDLLQGGDGNDTITGDSGSNVVDGGDGNDSISGHSDTLIGGAGDDTVESLSNGSWTTFHVDNADGNDVLIGYEGAGDNVDNLEFYATTSGDGVTITYSSNESGSYTFNGASGTGSGTFSGFERVDGTENADVYDLSGSTGGDNWGVWTHGGDDLVLGSDFTDGITVGDGDNTVYGGDGDDYIESYTSGGSDLIFGDAGNDNIDFYGANSQATVDGGTGDDGLYWSSSDITYVLQDGFGNDTLTANWDTFDGVSGDGIDASALSNGVSVSFSGGDEGILTEGANSVTFDGQEFFTLTGQADSFDGTNSAVGYTIDGGAGDDTLTGGITSDTLSGGDGADSITGTGLSYDDMITAGDGDTVTGTTGQDTLSWTGGAGDTSTVILDDGAGTALDSDAAIDTIYVQGTGNGSTLYIEGFNRFDDQIFVSEQWTNYSQVTLASGHHQVTLTYASGDTQLFDIQHAGNTFFSSTVFGVAAPGGDTLDGGAGDDTITGSDDGDSITGGDGLDSITGGVGNDTFFGGVGGDTIAGGDGDDAIDGGSGDDSIVATAGADTLEGGAGADTLTGGAGDDRLLGGSGDDVITGSSGDDVAFGGAGQDTFTFSDGFGNDTIQGGEDGTDVDTLDFSNLTGPVTIGSSGLVEAGTVTNGTDTVAFSQIENLILTDQGDEITSVSASITYETMGGDDTIAVGGGQLDIDAGDDDDRVVRFALTGSNDTGSVIDGGSGVDTYVLTTGLDRNIVNLTDQKLYFSTSDRGDLLNFENVELDDTDGNVIGDAGGNLITATGNFTNSLSGEAGADTILAGAGNDTLSGGSGDDSLVGGSGDDFITVGTGRDTAFGGEGDDTILNSSGDDSLVGGSGDDSIVATAGADTLEGGAGNDTLIGGSGDDSLVGGSGFDLLDGGSGDDEIFGGSGDDTLTFEDGFGADTIFGGEGGSDTDTLDFSGLTGPVTVTFTGNEAGTVTNGTDTLTFSEIERFILTSGDDALFGGADGLGMIVEAGAGADTIFAGTGDDNLSGGAGDDEIFSSDGADTIFGGAGADDLGGNSGDDSVDGGSGDDFLQGMEGADTVSGGAGNDAVLGNGGSDRLFGGAGNDTVTAGSGDDSLEGGSGNDSLNAGSGNDTLFGGSGDDVLNVDDTDGASTLFGGDGRDTLDVDGASGFDVTFNTDDGGTVTSGGTATSTFSGLEDIQGSEGSDTIDGSAKTTGFQFVDDRGSDSVTGGSGADTILAESGDDSVSAGGGADRVEGGQGADSIEGGSGDDTLHGSNGGSGSDGADTIRGGAGADEITGDVGDDSLFGDSGDDAIEGAEGSDTIFGGAGNDYLAGFDVSGLASNAASSNLTPSNSDDSSADEISGGSGDDIVLGGRGADTLAGDIGADTLSGGSGDDQIDGGAGNDSLTGGDGFDTFVLSSGDDTISDFGNATGAVLNDGDQTNNDFVDLSAFYDNISEVRGDFDDDGILNQSNATDDKGRATDYSDNTAMSGGTRFSGVSSSDEFTQDNTNVVCFAEGTMITTPAGDVPVEKLNIGDLVETMDRKAQPIAWIGYQKISARCAAAQDDLRPVKISAGALGSGLPHKDLIVSQQHRMLVSGPIAKRMFNSFEVLMPAKALLGAPGVTTVDVREDINLVHFMFENHEIVFADGAPSETFFPGPTALGTLPTQDREAVLGCLSRWSRIDGPAVSPARKFVKVKAGRSLIARHVKNGKPLLGGGHTIFAPKEKRETVLTDPRFETAGLSRLPRSNGLCHLLAKRPAAQINVGV